MPGASLAFGRAGSLYATTGPSNTVIRIDARTRAHRTSAGAPGELDFPRGIAIPHGGARTVYVGNATWELSTTPRPGIVALRRQKPLAGAS